MEIHLESGALFFYYLLTISQLAGIFFDSKKPGTSGELKTIRFLKVYLTLYDDLNELKYHDFPKLCLKKKQ